MVSRRVSVGPGGGRWGRSRNCDAGAVGRCRLALQLLEAAVQRVGGFLVLLHGFAHRLVGLLEFLANLFNLICLLGPAGQCDQAKGRRHALHGKTFHGWDLLQHAPRPQGRHVTERNQLSDRSQPAQPDDATKSGGRKQQGRTAIRHQTKIFDRTKRPGPRKAPNKINQLWPGSRRNLSRRPQVALGHGNEGAIVSGLLGVIANDVVQSIGSGDGEEEEPLGQHQGGGDASSRFAAQDESGRWHTGS